MDRRMRAAKPIVYGLLIFITVGYTVANEMLSRFGLEGNYIWIFSIALLVASLLLGKNLVMVGLVIVGVGLINLPEMTLQAYGLDRDVVLAVVCAIIMVPSIYSLVAR